MRKLLPFLLVLLAAQVSVAQFSSSPSPIRNLLPTCAATSGRCPNNNYFCMDSSNRILRCSSPNTWTTTAAGSISSGTTPPATCSVGDLFQDTDAGTGQQLYACESANTWVAQGGGGGGITGGGITGLADADILIYDTGGALWHNRAMSGDVTITDQGATTIGADKVALTTDTTGNYVASATANGGLTLTGTEGGSLGMLASCASGEILKWNATAWACATDAGAAAGSSDIGTVGTCTIDPCFTATTHTITEGIFWEGTANDFETGISAVDPTADRTLALPNESGTFCSTGSVCTGYQGVLTNMAGLESAVGGANVIQSTEIDTIAELNAILTTEDVVDLASTQVISGDKTFSGADSFTNSAGLSISAATANLNLKDSQATDGDVNVSLLANCTTVTSGAENCDLTIGQQSAGTLQNRIVMDADGDILIDGYRDVLQLRIQAHSTQTSEVFRIENSSADDIFTCTTSECVVGDIAGDGNRGIETIDNSSACKNPSSGSTGICTIGGELYTRDTGVSSTRIPKTMATTLILENLTDTDDNYPAGVQPYAITITGVGCRCRSNCGTPATIRLEDGGSTAVSSTDATCVASPTAITYTAPSGGTATFTAGEVIQFDTTNSPTASGIYEISYTWTVQ